MNHAPDAPPSDEDLDTLMARQRAFYDAGHTRSESFRRGQLKALRAELVRRTDDINQALHEDLHKCEFEAYTAETAFVLTELDHALKHLSGWMAPRRKRAPAHAMPGRMEVHPQPLGLNLIIGPWNYPVQLVLAPLVGAIAAGNCAVLKPSELAPASSELVRDLIRSIYPPEFVTTVLGGVQTAQALLARPWDHLFFTGGTRVGKIVAKAGAEHLSRVTLELGGKSPAIVTSSAQLEVAARRIAWGKWMNAGQTCIAPDHVLVAADVHDAFVTALDAAITQFYGPDPAQSPDLSRIINEHHFDRLTAMIDPAKVHRGGERDRAERYIAPTVLTGVTLDDACMQEEIFRPILPVLKVSDLDDAIATVAHHPDPLALYLFTEDRREIEAVTQRVSFGGGCINNVVLHITDMAVPFGGIRTSGVGAYHGETSFRTFSHDKALLVSNSSRWLDLDVKYPPYAGKLDTFKWLI